MSALDLVIRDATILDGSGRAGVPGDVGVRGARIASVGEVRESAAREIAGGGLVLAPGFVDAHTHDDGALLAHPGMEFKLSQGVTSVVVGNCGFSAAPSLSAGAGGALSFGRASSITSSVAASRPGV